MKGSRALACWRWLPVLPLLLGAACGGPQTLGDADDKCFRDDDCSPGLICVAPATDVSGVNRVCSSDPTPLISNVDGPPVAMGGDAAMAGMAGMAGAAGAAVAGGGMAPVAGGGAGGTAPSAGTDTGGTATAGTDTGGTATAAGTDAGGTQAGGSAGSNAGTDAGGTTSGTGGTASDGGAP